jgi:hypothetical protein
VRKTVAVVVAAATLTAAPAASAVTVPDTGTVDLASDTDVRMAGLPAGSETGFAVAAAGDVNGDGLTDVLVGPRSFDGPDRTDSGAAYVIFGSRDRVPVDLANLGQRGFQIRGAAAGDEAGHGLSGPGDVNGDGLADVVIGAPGADPGGRTDAGSAYVVFGQRATDPVDLANLGAAGYRIDGAAAGDSAGFSVSSLPDANGDARAEIVVGAPRVDRADAENAGAAFVVFSTGTPGNVDLAALGGAGYAIVGEQTSYAGFAVAGTPDMNGDGLGEVAIGAPFYSADGAFQGAAYVAFGQAGTQPVDLKARFRGFALVGNPSTRFAGQENAATAVGDTAGGSIASVGDWNGDGRPDVAIGAPRSDFRQRENGGTVYVVFGKVNEDRVPLAQLGTGGVRIDGAADGDGAGVSVGAAGDFDGDGKGDLLLGAPFADPLSRSRAGAAYVVYNRGETGGLDLASLGDRGVRIAGAAEGDTIARSVAGVGDFNGDGGPDVLVGDVFSRANADAEPSGSAELLYSPRVPVDAPPPDPGQQAEVAAGCRAARNVEVVIDDSGSMSGTDPERLRRYALELMITKPRNEGDTLGALEFGDLAEPLFPPQIIEPPGPGSNQSALLKLIDQRIGADNGGTDYNAGFGVLADENPGAAARIFLTDGAHNVGEYQQGHKGGPRTYVIGLQIGRKGADAERLARIASETGGKYYPDTDADELQRVMNAIDSRLNCDIEVDNFETTVDPQSEADAEQTFDTQVDDATESADVIVGWDDPSDEFDVTEIALLDDSGAVTARISAKTLRRAVRRGRRGGAAVKGNLRIQGRAGKTYRSYRVNGVGGSASMHMGIGRGRRPPPCRRPCRRRPRVSAHINQSRRLR